MRGRPALHLIAADPREHDLQIGCTEMLRLILLPDVCWTAIDHAHSIDRSKVNRRGVPIGVLEMAKRKARGVQPGIWDYIFLHRGSAFSIEMKEGDGNLSDDQITWGKRLIRAGVGCKVCWSKEQVFNTVVAWELTRPMGIAA